MWPFSLIAAAQEEYFQIMDLCPDPAVVQPRLQYCTHLGLATGPDNEDAEDFQGLPYEPCATLSVEGRVRGVGFVSQVLGSRLRARWSS